MASRLAFRGSRIARGFDVHCTLWPTVDVTRALASVLARTGAMDAAYWRHRIQTGSRDQLRTWTIAEGWMIGHCDRGWYWTCGPAFEYRRQFHRSFEVALRNFALAWARENIEDVIAKLVIEWAMNNNNLEVKP